MATSSSISRKLFTSLFSKPFSHFPSLTKPFSTTSDSEPEESETPKPRPNNDRPLEENTDIGIYKAILIGQVGQTPIQKKLRSGRTVTLLSLGTGGIRNNRRPLDNEEPRDYANRCSVQWHRVSVYPERLGDVAFKNVVSGSVIYVEGNLETKIFNDPVTGLVRRIREVAVRRNGRILFLGDGEGGEGGFTRGELGGVGYY